jgi:hypothetical protein
MPDSCLAGRSFYLWGEASIKGGKKDQFSAEVCFYG